MTTDLYRFSSSNPPGASRPLVAVPSCRKMVDPHWFHGAGEKYLSALETAAEVTPLIVPALGPVPEVQRLIEHIDGVFLTGSPSNVEPHHYRGEASAPGTLHDPHRDAMVLPFIRACLHAGLPMFAVCRGAQELNVVLGGSLHQRIQDLENMMDHRAPPHLPPEQAYAPAHAVTLSEGGWLHRLAGTSRVSVNSLHAQGVDRLGEMAVIEAIADDNLIEAYRVEGFGEFVLAVQWHPEWQVRDNPFAMAIFRSFGHACRNRATQVSHDANRAMV